ncbi:MAG TPA: 3,4-dihydroxy-2-butanone-4-phosphate synthase [Saprospiraceae bacterium]|nr:3,4-dihydroxy-2-butanone-4-phosphate synthase [Saprospirales bacterium]HRQ30463.1 3,4-dihydroxy-2-butanone-4-phosphate synthase [Saprospiraceae bacterium]
MKNNMEIEPIVLDTIESAIEDIRDGKVVIVVDDEDRENEGDFICAAEMVTPEIINFMSKVGRGLICAPIEESRARELGLELMVRENTALHETAFTVSVDLVGYGCTTGISTHDRAKTIKSLTDDRIRPEELSKPGHIFPLVAKKGGVLRRTGHTEAAIDLARLAGFKPAGALVEILNEDGTMARLPQLFKLARECQLKIISIEDLVAFRLKTESTIEKEIEVTLNSKRGELTVAAYRQLTTNDIHFALIKGKIDVSKPVMVRVFSSSQINNVFDTICGRFGNVSFDHVMDFIEKEGSGVILYMNHKETTEELLHRLKELGNGKSIDEMSFEQRDFGIGAQILREIGIREIKLLSRSKLKRVALQGYELTITEIVEI